MFDQTSARSSPWPRAFPLLPSTVLITVVFASSIYANLSFAVTSRAHYRYFPPFQPYLDANWNRALGGEYINIARSLTAGEGFAHPFDQPSGPTSWQPPLYPLLLAGLLWVCSGDLDVVVGVVIFLQVYTLIGTGFLVLALVRRTTRRIAPLGVILFYLTALLCHFRLWFQYTHDCWILLLALDGLVAGLCWLKPLHFWWRAAGWGLFGGLCALTSPVAGFTWAALSLLSAIAQRNRARLALALVVAALTLSPWTVRNYLVFGRWIPLKSNLAYELYQTQCLQESGLLQAATFRLHPYHPGTLENRQYLELKEPAYLDHKWQQVRQAIWSDPGDFPRRVFTRFLGATLWYVPMWISPTQEPVAFWLNRTCHPLPLLALLLLVARARFEPVHPTQWIVIGVYLFYLLPYVGVSYYERYAAPLLFVKVMLVLWALDRLLGKSSPGQEISSRA